MAKKNESHSSTPLFSVCVSSVTDVLTPRGERRFEKPLRREVTVTGRPGFEEAAAAPPGPGRKEYTRADSDNWRTLREEQAEEEGGGAGGVAVSGGGGGGGGVEPGSSWRMGVCRRDGTRCAHTFTHTCLRTHLHAHFIVLLLAWKSRPNE